jgi:hypothetical protein
MKPERVLKKNAIKAFKAFNRDLTCKGFQYEVGKEYQHKGKLEMCNSGFHACPKLADCFKYYRFSAQETRVAEVLVWGSLDHDNGAGSKLCASNIKIVRELSWHEVTALCNTGASNSGFRNTGDWNSGSWNSGNHNSGDWNSGNNNSGDCNIGDFNTGNWNAGIFNTGACEYAFAFNQLVKKQDLECLPSIPFLRFKLVEWIPEKHMLPEEKEQHPKYATAGGYLKKYDYKEAFRKSFEEARRKPDWPEQLEKLKSLPNFDAKIFEEISGITAEELTGSTVEKLTTKPKRKREKSTKGA